MSSLAKKFDYVFRAVSLEFQEDQLCLHLEDGREIRTPLEFFPKLARAEKEVQNNFRIFGQGTGIEWPDLDEHLSVEGIVLGKPVADW
jgi:hypothetical protein